MMVNLVIMDLMVIMVHCARIGVHTGYIMSGLIGLRKWQYEIFSNDVTIAEHMESSGQPG